MKILKTSELNAQNKETYQLLNAIKELIKTNSLRQEGFEKLIQIDSEELCIKNQVFYYYIKGKYYVLTFKDQESRDLELLSYANDCYTDMVAIAYDNNFSITSAKNHFARAYCKYLIAENHTSEEVKAKLFQKVEQISNRILRYQPDNTSFHWLLSQIKL